ncbi:MAG: HEAT repeat domain-containing protein [Verrucomicrobiae bacterium]|nr:HEAT repeat domain-containing protein [Verrucomicrobiae bacterium]
MRIRLRRWIQTLASLVAGGLGLGPGFSQAAAPLTFQKNERLALVGGGLGERMGLYGNFEALLHARFPDRELVVRNFCRPADEVTVRQRPNDYTKIDDPLKVFSPDIFLCLFGFNESFAGPDGLEAFREAYAAYLDTLSQTYGRDGQTRLVLVSPIAFENSGDPFLPDGLTENANLEQYAGAIRDLAAARGVAFVDLFTPTRTAFDALPGAQFTTAGFLLNQAGDRLVGGLLDRALFGEPGPSALSAPDLERLREAVVDKAWVHQQDYRMLNGWYVYGGRRTWDLETFPLEYQKIRNMAAVRDQFVWSIANGTVEQSRPDDSRTGELFVPKTRFGVPQQAYSEPKALRYLSGDEALKEMKVADGFDVSLFAAEDRFPELAKPMQLAFDNRGRLWVACMPTYPQWKPGDPRPGDRLLILEDLDRDGQADKCTVFYDQLHCPVGFEFWNGGVLVNDQPRLTFLKDTNGDDRADQVIPLLDGWATDDTHHSFGKFQWSPEGRLHALEGVSMSTTVETPWGPLRNANTPGVYVLDPRSMKVRHFITPGYGNPWCLVHNFWGQGIPGDGTTAQQHWNSPLSGSAKGQRKGLNAIFDHEGMRPALGSEFLYSRHFPDEVQGQFVYGCVINMNGIPRFTIGDDGAGYRGQRVKRDVVAEGQTTSAPDNLLESGDRNFRPGVPQIGPDGALWFLDWHNALIGHMQYSQRDPNRDKTRGRIYRITAKGRPLLTPVTQHGKSVPELLNQLKEYEPRTRYRVRRELRDRPATEVLPAVTAWIGRLNPADPWHDLHQLEALYVQAGFHALDTNHLKRVLGLPSRDARAMAVHVLGEELAYVSDPMPFLRRAVSDTDPRVRLEALRALSFLETEESVAVALETTRLPLDYWLDYTLQHTLGALQPVWQPALETGRIAQDNPSGREYLDNYQKGQPSLGLVKQSLQALIESPDLPEDQRERHVAAVTRVRGRVREGRFVFERVCTSCHRVKDIGIDYGPELTEVAARMNRQQLAESILYPNQEVAPQWLTTNITTRDGEEFSGVVAAEDEATVTLKLGGDLVQRVAKDAITERDTLKVSNMPEGLAAGLAPQEFVDLIEYLASLK